MERSLTSEATFCIIKLTKYFAPLSSSHLTHMPIQDLPDGGGVQQTIWNVSAGVPCLAQVEARQPEEEG